MTDAQTLLQEGLSAFRARAYDQALQSWRALLEIKPDNQHVLQLVERTEALAAEGHLVHSLKEELADLREELASTRQARNDLLIEMARVHKKYQAREARLWRLQEEREWELRDALAHAELSNLAPGDADANAEDADENHRLTTKALDEAHAHIRRLRDALHEAHARIESLEAAAPRGHTATVTDTVDDEDLRPPAAPAEAPETPASERPRRDTANTPHPPAFQADDDADASPARAKPTQTRPSRTLPDEEKDDAASDASVHASRRDSAHTHTQTSHTLRTERSLFETGQERALASDDADFDGPLISDEWLQDSTEEDADDAPVPDALVDIVRDVSSDALDIGMVQQKDEKEEGDAGPIRTASAPEEDSFSDDDVPTTEHVVSRETSVGDRSDDTSDTEGSSSVEDASDKEEDGAEDVTIEDAKRQEDSSDLTASGDQKSHRAPLTQRAAPVPPAAPEDEDAAEDEPKEEARDEDETGPSDASTTGAKEAASNMQVPPQAPTAQPDTVSASPTHKKAKAPPPAPSDAPIAPESSPRSNIPDTAKIDAEPMDDKNLADGFADELTSALGSTPAPPRLFTGVQPELPDMDILDEEPQKMRPEDLEKFPTSVPVRHKLNPTIDDPIARYLLTHVDGVSTFMELRGTVGLPPAAVDRGFRILLAHDIIRVQHE